MEKEEKTKIPSARRLLRRLRVVMSADTSVEKKLDEIMQAVAAEMQTQVCSFYLQRPGDILELYATYGLKKEAIHETTLRLGEGLIGTVALQKKTMIFNDAWHHPNFVFKPETGEKLFNTLMATPVMKGNQLLGVLAVQTEDDRAYTEDEEDILETVAMLIVQLITSVDFKEEEHAIVHERKDARARLEGVRLHTGMTIGRAFVHSRIARIDNLISSKSENVEVEKLNQALAQMENAVNEMLSNPTVSDENADIFETYRMFTQDKGWIRKMMDYIHTGLSAEGAVQKVADDMTERMSVITDPYLKERIHDFQDLTDRLLQHLAGKDVSAKNKDLDGDTILIAKSMGPAELLDYDKDKIKGIILEEGSPTMHVVIIAKSLNIPVVGGLKGISENVSKGDMIAMDGDSGFVYINPIDDILNDFKKKIEQREKIRKKYGRLKNLPCVTKDGKKISLNINAGLALDMLSLGDGFADGIGLYRTELPFMSTPQLPDTQKQTEIYKRTIANADGKPIVFRTLDIGSDKVLPYVQHKEEENPAMGWRSIRITLDRRTLLRQQLRAFIRAVHGQELHVMFPMITDVDEFIEAKNTLDLELEREKDKGHVLPSKVYVGTMLEVPSLLFQLDELLPKVDFVSVGTNDLSQFLFATDRSDPSIWERYDVLSAPMIRTLQYILKKCQKAKVVCSVCGEMAGKPLEAMVLVGLGFEKLSMNAGTLGAVKAMILSMNAAQVKDYIDTILPLPEHSLREKLRLYALDHNINI